MESITAAPSEDSFVPLSEHESQTPSTFFGSRAILHLHLSSVQLLVDSEQLEASPELAKLHEPAGAEQASHAERLALPDIQLWVTSKHFILFSNAARAGVTIDYPTISLHAIQRFKDSPGADEESCALYVQLVISPLSGLSSDPEDDLVTVDFTIIPQTTSPTAAKEPIAGDDAIAESSNQPGGSGEDVVKELYAAISTCTALHPDEVEDADDSTAPGTGGWITSENMGDFSLEDGDSLGHADISGQNGRAAEDGDDGTSASELETGASKWRRLD